MFCLSAEREVVADGVGMEGTVVVEVMAVMAREELAVPMDTTRQGMAKMAAMVEMVGPAGTVGTAGTAVEEAMLAPAAMRDTGQKLRLSPLIRHCLSWLKSTPGGGFLGP
jgi:hypothetical protein